MKTCKTCGVNKTEDQFRSRLMKGQPYVVAECRGCELEKGRAYDAKRRATNPAYVEANRLRSAEYLEKQKARRAALTTATCRNCKTEKQMSEFAETKRRPTTCLACQAARKKRNQKEYRARPGVAEKYRGRSAKWLADNPEKRKAYYTANLAKFLAYNYNRTQLVRAAGNGVEVTPADKKRIRQEQCDTCAFCAVPLTGGCHFDHIIPVIRGGAHEPGNLQALCPTCNMRKGKLGPLELLLRRGYNFQNGPIMEFQA